MVESAVESSSKPATHRRPHHWTRAIAWGTRVWSHVGRGSSSSPRLCRITWVLWQLRTLGIFQVVVEVHSLQLEWTYNVRERDRSLIDTDVRVCIQTSSLTSSIFSACLLCMCFLTNSGPLNFLPLSGQSHLSLASSCVLVLMNFSTSVSIS